MFGGKTSSAWVGTSGPRRPHLLPMRSVMEIIQHTPEHSLTPCIDTAGMNPPAPALSLGKRTFARERDFVVVVANWRKFQS